jgi:protease-4
MRRGATDDDRRILDTQQCFAYSAPQHVRSTAQIPALRTTLHSTLALSLVLVLQGCVLVTGTFNPFASTPEPLEEHVVDGKGRAKVLLIDVSRVISSQSEAEAFGVRREEATTARVLAELNRAREDDAVRAVVLRINSPGGTVTASDTVFHEVMRFKSERRVPVVTQMLDTATSGAYYVSLASDVIVASPTTITGSVGVVLYGVNLSGLMAKIGIADQTLKSGALKDAGSPLRPMTAADAETLQSILAQMQQRFLAVVQERRPALQAAALDRIADGRVLSADEALQWGLIDRIGYLEDAIGTARERAGLTEARVVMYRRSQEYAENIYSRSPLGIPQVNVVNVELASLGRLPQFMYLWVPGLD